MSIYPTVENAVLALIRSYTTIEFTEANSSIRKYRVLDAKGTPWAAVVQQHRNSRFGFTLRDRAAQGKRQEEHVVRVEVYMKIGQGRQGLTGEDLAYQEVRDAVAEIASYITAYVRLGGVDGVKRATVDEVTPPGPIAKRNSPEAATHYGSDVIVTVFCEVPYNIVEPGQ